MCRRILTRDPALPRRVDGRIPRDLETVVLKAMEKRPERRYATAGEMARDLRRFAEGAAVRARRVGPLGRTWRRVKRHRGKAALAASLVVAVAAAAFLGLRGAAEARRRVDLEYAQLCARAAEALAQRSAREDFALSEDGTSTVVSTHEDAPAKRRREPSRLPPS